MTQNEHIALLGGSFNPPHAGHVAVCRWLADAPGVDRVWAIPCFMHPFGKELAPYGDRFRMCELALASLGDRIGISDIERDLGGVSYTVRTVEHLAARYPESRFSLAVGDDVTQESHAWRDFGRIRELVSVIRIPRGKDSPLPDVSATEIRARVSSGKSIEGLVPPEVAAYIAAHRLYVKTPGRRPARR